MWKRVAAAAGLVAAVMAAAACGAGSNPPAAPTAAAPTPPAAIGRCGSVTAADLARATGLSGLQQVAANPLRCSWETAADSDYAVIFQWFRGTPLAVRRTQVTLGAPSSVTVGGHTGILWTGRQACELAVSSGGEDFIDWILTGTGRNPARPQGCSDLEQLAVTTLAKAG